MKSRLCFFLLVLVSAMSAFADDERAVTSIAVIVYTDGMGDGIPKACFYDRDKVKASGLWKDGLIDCDPVLIGKPSTPTPKSPPKGFDIERNDTPMKQTHYTCVPFLRLTGDGAGMHCVLNTEKRKQALRHPTAKNTRITDGCINMPNDGLFPWYADRIVLVHVF